MEPLPVKKTVKKYKVFPAGSKVLPAAFHAARHNACSSMEGKTSRLFGILLQEDERNGRQKLAAIPYISAWDYS